MTDLADRYGATRRGSRRAVVAVTVLVAVAGLTWLGWAMLAHGRPLAQSDLNGFETVDQHTTTARFTVVRRDGDVEASCLLRAYAADHAVVGELDVTVGPGGPTEQVLERSVRTERAATSVDIVGCVADGQTHRR